MRTRNYILSALFASLVCIISASCSTKSGVPNQIKVDKNVTVAIYSVADGKSAEDTISPCLLSETVHISELRHYPGDEGVTMPFTLSDTAKYAEITGNNLEKRIAISVNGQVIYTPVVKMKIVDGACSVVLDETQAKHLFPNTTIEELLSTNH